MTFDNAELARRECKTVIYRICMYVYEVIGNKEYEWCVTKRKTNEKEQDSSTKQQTQRNIITTVLYTSSKEPNKKK